MKVAILFFPVANRQKLLSLARGLSKGLEKQGHQVDIIDGSRDVNSKLTIYGYIAVGTSTTTLLGGKIPEIVSRFLANSGIVSGKRCFAFILKKGLRTEKTLSRLMKTMEQEGMYLKYSDVISSEEEAVEIGKKLHTE